MRKFTHAKMAHIFTHAPIFISMERGYRKQESLKVEYHLDGTTFYFSGPELLGALDLRVFQSLIAAATAERNAPNGVKQLFRNAKTIATGLKYTGEAGRYVIATPISLSQIANSIGYKTPSGETFKRIRESLQRLHETELSFREGEILNSTRIVSEIHESVSHTLPLICLNRYSSTAIIRKTNYVRVDLDETRNITSDPCRILHHRLQWINKGSSRMVSFKKICGYIYGENSDITASATSRRKQVVHKALIELEAKLNWKVRVLKKDMFEIYRLKEQVVSDLSNNHDRPNEDLQPS